MSEERAEYITKSKNQQFGNWTVDPLGNMSYHNGRYLINVDQLDQEDWFVHLSTKAWIDWNEFLPAYLQALKNANIRKVTFISAYQSEFNKPSS